LKRNRTPNRIVYPHFTCATDSQSAQVVFEVCKEAIIQECMNEVEWELMFEG